MRLYVSGPVTGKENRNVDDFKRTRAFLMDAGYQVVIPTDLVNDPPTMTRGQITCRCLSELLNCDGVALLRGWRRSPGACLEVAVATACGKDAKAAEAWLERS